MRTAVNSILIVLFLHFISKLAEKGRTIVRAVSRRLPIVAVRVRSQVRSCGICGGQSGSEAGFLRVLRFPLPILIPPTASHSSPSIIRDWYNRPNSGPCATPTQETEKKKNANAVNFMSWIQGFDSRLEHRMSWLILLSSVLLLPLKQMLGQIRPPPSTSFPIHLLIILLITTMLWANYSDINIL
jgi:hypothetical protein